MMLGKLPVLGRPANLDNSRARAYCACRQRQTDKIIYSKLRSSYDIRAKIHTI